MNETRQPEASPLYTERDRAALAFAEALTDPARRVDDACIARLRAHVGHRDGPGQP
jgi:alkylhydroperoxidase family enzyme